MSKNYSNIKERTLHLAELQEDSKQDFFRKVGLKYSNFTGKSKESDLNSKAVAEILLTYPEINPIWLLTGNGPVKKNENEIISRTLRTDNIEPQQLVPYYNLTATASVLQAFTNEVADVPIEHISIPNLPKCDGALNITGDSMYPLLKSGDIVMYKNVADVENIIWGEMYLIYINNKGDEFFFCKFIQKSEKRGYVKLVSQNNHHEPKNFPIGSIKQLAIVKASIRINSVV